MNYKQLFLCFGIILLSITYVFYKPAFFFPVLYEWLLFSKVGLLLLGVIAIISAILLFFAYRIKDSKHSERILKSWMYVLAILVVLGLMLLIFGIWAIATIITMAGVVITAKLAKRPESYKFYVIVVVGILLTVALTSIFLINRKGFGPNGVDENTYMYYASYLFLHGMNPYTGSMQNAVTNYNVTPTIRLDGTKEYPYIFPALSFIATLFIPAIGAYSVYYFIAILAFLTVFSAFLVYYKSGYKEIVLLPLMIWVLITFIGIVTIGQYMAVSLFLLIAYMERKNLVLSGILLGLAISTIQLAWFALPFFLIVILNEQGKKNLFKYVAVSLFVFLLINGYFLILSPKQFVGDLFTIFGSAKVVPSGPNLMNILLPLYTVPIWYNTAIAIILLLTSIMLFYFYTDTLKVFLALVPMFIFFASWQNLASYGLSFMPLLIVIVLIKEKGTKDRIKSKNPLYFTFIFITVFAIILLLIAHFSYTQENTLSINSVKPVVQNYSSTNNCTISHLVVNLTNNGNSYENVSFFLLNRYPKKYEFVLAPNLTGIAPHSYKNYNLNFTINNVKNTTDIALVVFSINYIRYGEVHVQIARNCSLSYS